MQNHPENNSKNKTKSKKSLRMKAEKYKINAVASLIFLLLIVLLGLLFFILPKKETSLLEQRKLSSFPEVSPVSIWNGDFTSGLNLYYSDNFAFREQFVKAKFAIEDYKGFRLDDVKIYNADSDSDHAPAAVNEASNAEISSKDDLSSLFSLKNADEGKTTEAIDLNNPYYTDPNKHFDIDSVKEELEKTFGDYTDIDEDELKGEKRGALFIVGDTALEIFYGNEAVSKDYANVINSYESALGSGVTVYNMIVPNHFAFGLPKKYEGQVGRDQKPFIDLIKNNLDENVVFVDIYDTMKQHYDAGEYLYFRTDHHWTGLGAYRAYEKFCDYAALKSIPLDNYEKRTSTGFLGSLYNSSLDKKLAENPDYVEYYVTDLPYEQTNMNEDGSTYKGKLISEYSSGKTNGYLTFMGGDIPLATIKTENENGRKIIVFKESYGNAFVPFLVPHYETVYVADIRTFPYNSLSFIKENNIQEVMFLNNIMSANTSARVANILNLMTK